MEVRIPSAGGKIHTFDLCVSRETGSLLRILYLLILRVSKLFQIKAVAKLQLLSA